MAKRTTADALRFAAEARLKEQQAATPLADTDLPGMLHELQVHQIELEMQNEALREAQTALEESRDRYVDLYEFAPVGYLTLTGVGQVTDANLTAAKMLGVEGKYLLGLRFAALIANSDRERWRRLLAGAMVDSRKHSLDLVLEPVNGSPFPAHIDCRRAEAGREAPVLRIALTDISELKRLENELNSLRRDLKQATEWQVARHPATAMAHEVNQPLASISALCEAADRLLAADGAAAGSLPARLADVMRLLAEESQRAGGMVYRLLDSLHIKDAIPEPIAVSPLLHEAVSLADSCGFKNCEVLIDCPDDMPPIHANRLQLQSVLVNLIGNGVEAMRAADRSHRRIWISVSRAGADACICVRDEGPGVEEGTEQSIFRPFVTTKPGHIGMGLPISRSLVEIQGGKLWYEARAGQGASFRFCVPCRA